VSDLLSTVDGQATAVETLRRALRSGRVPHAYLFDGPDGVGKERAAFGLAQALVCERRSDTPAALVAQGTQRSASGANACGLCSACTRAVPRPGEARPAHPDIAVIERGLYDPATIGRRSPETQDISIDQVRTIVLAHAAFPPLEGKAKVFVVRRAEELSTAAANALLKTLEEPGPRTYFVLLSSAAGALLSTLRSRTQRLRFAPLPSDVVARLLILGGVAADRAAAIARLAGGSMQTAFALADPEATARREDFLSRAKTALQSRALGDALDLAEEAKKTDKTAVIRNIEALALVLGERAREAAIAGDAGADIATARHALAVAAVAQLEANASTQLAVESMLIRMRAAR
jgi:DNA polymerase-3 subunit delta'